MASPTTSQVHVYVYDLTKGVAKSISPFLLGKQLAGIWHTGIVVFDQEYFFGSGGIDSCPPCGTVLGNPDRIIDLGTTEIPLSLFLEYLCSLGESTFKPDSYDLFTHNCNNFSQEIAVFLTGKSIPQEILELPNEVLSTPLGSTLKAYLTNLNIQQNHSLDFPEDTRHIENYSQLENHQDDLSACMKSGLNITTDLNPAKIFDDDNMAEVVNSLISKLPPNKLAESELLRNLANYSKENRDIFNLEFVHLQVLGNLLDREDTSEIQKLILQMLQSLALSNKFVLLLSEDKNNFIMKYIFHMSELPADLQLELLKFLCNLSTIEESLKWSMSERKWSYSDRNLSNCKVTTNAVVDSLLSESSELQNMGSEFLYNLSLNKKLGNNTITELATAVLQLLQADLSEETAYNCLAAFSNFLNSPVFIDILALAEVLESDFQKFQHQSERNRELVNFILEKLSFK
ncbi:uncharacterized protein [Centruroides vittatus]|uniref:uncharacterized protein n=1 Tax=Centruroides vittatus TaxID=120091 RepID=UPI00350FB846